MIYSWQFILFIAVLLMLYYILPHKHQWRLLLLASYVFYFWQGGKYVIFIIFTTLFTFFIAQSIERIDRVNHIKGKEKKKKKQLQVGITCLVCFAILFLFKVPRVTSRFSVVLPLGLSYYTFQSIGYIIDVYRGKYSAEKNICKYALFVGYFPTMLQGPINRFDQMKSQFAVEHSFQLSKIRDGIWLFLWGLFKKLVIADRCALYVNNVLSGEKFYDYSGSVLLIGVMLFVLQMYGDFSGGIDMVEGVSEMFGITMYQNFRQPFFARTIGEYWRRWHISLSNWIRDYVFYSMALSKPYRKLTNVIKKRSVHLGKTIPSMLLSIITFVMIGLWHELTANYVLYGIWYGGIMGASEMIRPVFTKCVKILNIKTGCFSYRIFERLRTWSIVLVGEMFSILKSPEDVCILIKKVFTDFKWYELFFDVYQCGLTEKDFLLLIVCALTWWGVSYLKEKGHSVRQELCVQNVWFRWGVTVVLITTIAIFGVYGPGYDRIAFLYGGV